jgi:hypothetical protein
MDAHYARIRDSNSFGSDCDDTPFAGLELDANVLSALDDDFDEVIQPKPESTPLKENTTPERSLAGFTSASVLLSGSPCKAPTQAEIKSELDPDETATSEIFDDFDFYGDLEFPEIEEEVIHQPDDGRGPAGSSSGSLHPTATSSPDVAAKPVTATHMVRFIHWS